MTYTGFKSGQGFNSSSITFEEVTLSSNDLGQWLASLVPPLSNVGRNKVVRIKCKM